ncbi:MAG: ribonuclease J [Candidatus Paceibacterota bacterium]|jgi:ribonuclease J
MAIRRIRVDENGNVQTFVGQPMVKQKFTPGERNKPGLPTGRPASVRPAKANSRPRQNRKYFSAGNRNENENGETKPPERIPDLVPGNIRIIPLGGVEEVGKNMTAVEFGNDILVIDAGFLLPGEDVPGVDYVIPDTTYLEERKSKIRAVLITHGHLDHIGGIPYLMDKIGNPPIYTSLLTAVMIKKRQEEFPHVPKLNIQVVESKDKIKFGGLLVRFFDTTHTIPDSIGIIIETPYGNIIVTGDIKLEHENGQVKEIENAVYTKIGKEKNLVLIAESTNVEKPGFSFSEKEVQQNLKNIIEKVPGRVIIGTFASLFERVISIIEACEVLGKKVAVEGRAMKTNIEIAKELGYLKVDKHTFISSEELDEYPDNKIVILATGAQGDEYAALMRISQREHRTVKLKKGDTILLSSSVIPGNEKAVQKLKDNLTRQGAKIIHYGIADVHSSGHAYQGELEWIQKMIKPQFFIPAHGNHYMLRVHADLAERLGTPEKNIAVPDNGSIIEIQDQGKKIVTLKPKASSRLVMVDGLGTGNVQEVVIRDRQMLSQDGMFVLITIIDMSTGKVRKSPDIISRGFVYLKESQDLLRYVRILTKKTIEDSTAKMHPINMDYVKNTVREELGKYLFQKTHKRPIILPVLIEV